MKTIFLLLFLPFAALAQNCKLAPENYTEVEEKILVREAYSYMTQPPPIIYETRTEQVLVRPEIHKIDPITEQVTVSPAEYKTVTYKVLIKRYCFFEPKKIIVPTEYKTIKKCVPNIQFYPNPATDFLTISMPNSNLLNFQLVDLNGKMVIERSIENEAILDISQIPNGIYYLIFRENDVVYRNKIIVQH